MCNETDEMPVPVILASIAKGVVRGSLPFVATTEHIQQEMPTEGYATEYTGCSGLYIKPVQTDNPELHHDVRDHPTSS